MPIKSVPQFAVIDVSDLGDNTIVAAVAGKKIRVLSVFLSAIGGLNVVRFESGASGTALTGPMALTDTVSHIFGLNGFGWFETDAGQLLNMELTLALQVGGCLVYEEIEE